MISDSLYIVFPVDRNLKFFFFFLGYMQHIYTLYTLPTPIEIDRMTTHALLVGDHGGQRRRRARGACLAAVAGEAEREADEGRGAGEHEADGHHPEVGVGGVERDGPPRQQRRAGHGRRREAHVHGGLGDDDGRFLPPAPSLEGEGPHQRAIIRRRLAAARVVVRPRRREHVDRSLPKEIELESELTMRPGSREVIILGGAAAKAAKAVNAS